jgi:hypothetical protein
MKLSKHAVRAAVVLLLLLPVAAWAGGVVTNCTEADLQAAMAGGGVVTFACDGTIALSSPLDISTYTVLDATNRKVTISGNSACRVFLVNSNVNFTVLNLAIANGRSDNGAGIYNAGGYLTVQNCVFVGNTAIGQAGVSGSPGTNGSGGALFNTGVAIIADSSFSTNIASGGAGGSGTNGIYAPGGAGGSGGLGYGGAIYSSGEVTLTNCTLNGNTAAGGAGGSGGNAGSSGGLGGYPGGSGGAGGSSCGGALFNGGIARLVNSTLTGNASTGGSGGSGGMGGWYVGGTGDGGNGNAGGSGSGGGLYDLTGHCFLTNCTVAFNPAIGGGGGAGGGASYPASPGLPGSAGSASGGGISSSGGAFLINVLLGSNAPNNGSGSIIDGGHNLSSDNSCGFTNVGSLNNTNPLVGPLTDNGGPTLTMALMPGSPAIDAGDDGAAPPVDQRGIPRPVGPASDIGAYECGPPAIMMPLQSQSVALGSTVDFSAPVAGYPPLNYQWFFNVTNAIAGATNSVLHLVSVQPSQSGVYTLVLSNTFGAVTSSPAQLDVVFRTVTRCTEAILRLAMAGGGTVTFACDGTITLAATINITADTVLDGSGHQVTISGGDAVRVFFVATNVNFEVVNLSIAHGLDLMGGGILNLAGNVSLWSCSFYSNSAVGAPGLGASGGAIANSGTLAADFCTFFANSAAGGVGGSGGGDGGDANGGAVYNLGILELSDSMFLSNSVSGGLGGMGEQGMASDVGLPGGPGGQGGGGNGSGLFNAGVSTVANCTFAGNVAMGGTGGPGGYGGFSTSPPDHPSRGGDGGSGGGGGSACGAICDLNALCFLTNCTVSSNSGIKGAGGPGGPGGFGTPGGSPGPTGPDGQATGAFKTAGGLLVNTIVANNAPSNCSGTITDAGHNISSDASCTLTNSGSMNNTDPKLGPLSDNGGPTLTMALLPGSPAIDAADPATAPATDQRGIPRPVGPAPDIGAFEYGWPAVLRISGSAGTGLDIVVSANPGQACRLLASSGFSNWIPVATNQIGTNGTLLWHEAWVSSGTGQFYRVVLP